MDVVTLGAARIYAGSKVAEIVASVAMATFEVDSDMCLIMNSPEGYDGITFNLNQGCLEVIV